MSKDAGISKDLKLKTKTGSRTSNEISLRMVSMRKQGLGAGPRGLEVNRRQGGRLVQPGDEDMVHRCAYRNVSWKWSSSEVTGSKSHKIIVMEES